MIEHVLEAIKTAGWTITLGPDGGEGGAELSGQVFGGSVGAPSGEAHSCGYAEGCRVARPQLRSQAEA